MQKRRIHVLIVLGFFNPSILSGFARYAREAGWVLNAFSVFHGNIPRDWPADGLLTTNVFRPDLRRFIRESARRIPTVLHGCNDLGLDVPNVECDEFAVGRLAARHLMDLGHRRFVFFHYSRNRHAQLRRDGFRAELRSAGLDCTILENITEHGAGIGPWFRPRLKRFPKPLGLFAEDDLLAAEVIEAALDSGWRVPEDLAVVGSGNLPLIRDLGRVPITSIVLPFEETAIRAAKLLDDLLHRRRLASRTLVFAPGRLVARQSTNAVAARRPQVQRALAWMMARLSDPALDAPTVAAGIGVSLRLLYQEFEQDLGSTPRIELERMRLNEAKHRLLEGRSKINTVAAQCGFQNVRTFQRAFQRAERQSPVKWRSLHRSSLLGSTGDDATLHPSEAR